MPPNKSLSFITGIIFRGEHVFFASFHRIKISWHCLNDCSTLLIFFHFPKIFLRKRNASFESLQGVYIIVLNSLSLSHEFLSLLLALHNVYFWVLLKSHSNKIHELSVVSCLSVGMLAKLFKYWCNIII